MSDEPAVLKCDNQSAISIVHSEKFTPRTRHLRAQDAYVREQVREGELIVEHVRTSEQLADLLTKSMLTGKFIKNRNQLLSKLEVL